MLPGGQLWDRDSCAQVLLWEHLLPISVKEQEEQDGADREMELWLCCEIQSHWKLWSQDDILELALMQVLEGQAFWGPLWPDLVLLVKIHWMWVTPDEGLILWIAPSVTAEYKTNKKTPQYKKWIAVHCETN